MQLKLDDFDFSYPPQAVAFEPAPVRDQSKLFLLNHKTGELRADTFVNLPEYLKAGDCLILNDVKVLPLRMQAIRKGGGVSEVLLISTIDGNPLTEADGWVDASGKRYRALCLRSKRFHPKTIVQFKPPFEAEVLSKDASGLVDLEVRAVGCSTALPFFSLCGEMPLPPYLDPDARAQSARENDRERYQTVYAQRGGAVAAPTAGLHFTPVVLEMLRSRGVKIHSITLNVSFGTFQPIRTENFREHRLHTEAYEIPSETARAIADTKKSGGRVIGVGTTVARTLESAANGASLPEAGPGETELFIHSDFQFRVLDGMLTNFHLPKSSLLLLVCAFAGRDRVLNAYQEAIKQGARLFSYGDSMLIL